MQGAGYAFAARQSPGIPMRRRSFHHHPAGNASLSGRSRSGLMLTLVLVVVGLAAAGAWWSQRDRSLAEVRQAGTVRIGYAVEAPYAFLTGEGRVTGLAPEAARRVAQRMGLGEPVWVLTEFSALIGGLKAGRFDVIAAGMFITPEREALVAFSRPMQEVGPGLLVAKGNPRGVASRAAALARPDFKFAVLAGSVELAELSGLGLPPERLAIVPDAGSGLALVAGGRADGLALSLPTVLWMAAQPSAADLVEVLAGAPGDGSTGRTAFGFRREDRALREEWDRHLEALLGTDEYKQLTRQFRFVTESMKLRRRE